MLLGFSVCHRRPLPDAQSRLITKPPIALQTSLLFGELAWPRATNLQLSVFTPQMGGVRRLGFAYGQIVLMVT